MLPTESAGTRSEEPSRRFCTSPIAPLTVGPSPEQHSRAAGADVHAAPTRFRGHRTIEGTGKAEGKTGDSHETSAFRHIARVTEARLVLQRSGPNTCSPTCWWRRVGIRDSHQRAISSQLLDAFKGQGKTGKGGDALPEAVIIDRITQRPLIVIEVKPYAANLPQADKDAIHYGQGCLAAGFVPVIAALAGADEDDFRLHVYKWTGERWVLVTYEGDPISWIPNRADVERLLPLGAPSELRPTVPPPEILAQRADEINRLLREARIQDAFRPWIVGAIMLALWQSKGNLRMTPEHISATSMMDSSSANRPAFLSLVSSYQRFCAHTRSDRASPDYVGGVASAQYGAPGCMCPRAHLPTGN